LQIISNPSPLMQSYSKIHCEDMGSEHISLSLQIEGRWLFREKVLVWVFKFHTEISVFFVEHPFHLSHCLSSITWLQKLAYFAGIFRKVSELNLCLHGKNITSIFTAKDKITAVHCKLEYYGNSIECKNVKCFQL